MKCKLNDKCEFGNLCKDATRHDSLTVLGCSSFKTEKPMTEQEYIQTCTTEQLAEFLACVEARQNADYNEETKAWVEWLKQPKE